MGFEQYIELRNYRLSEELNHDATLIPDSVTSPKGGRSRVSSLEVPKRPQ